MVEVQPGESMLMEEVRALRERVARLEAEAEQLRVRRCQESEELVRLVADSAPVMVWVSGPDGQCTFFNRHWLRFRGRQIEEELGDGWLEGVHPEDRERCLSTYRAAFEARQDFQMEYRIARADGQYRWIVDSGAARYDSGGTFAGYIGSGYDIHDRKASESAAAPAGISLTQREKQVLVLIADGKSTKEAAATLGISYKTADSHRSKIMEKLGVHETASLVRYAIRHNFVKA